VVMGPCVRRDDASYGVISNTLPPSRDARYRAVPLI
jgi:hypothetical protein